MPTAVYSPAVGDELSFPSVLYGPAKVVRQRVNAAIKALAAGTSWSDAFGSNVTTLVTSTQGLVVLNGPAPLLASEPHFHAFLPLVVLQERVRKGRLVEAQIDDVVAASLGTPWGLLGLLSNPNLILAIPKHRHRPIASALVSHWEALKSAGPRYSSGGREGQLLWEIPNNAGYVLTQLGLSSSELNRPLSCDDLRLLAESVLRANRQS